MKKPDAHNRKKLSLPKEIVRSLRPCELRGVAGGYSDESSCWPAFCDPEWP